MDNKKNLAGDAYSIAKEIEDENGYMNLDDIMRHINSRDYISMTTDEMRDYICKDRIRGALNRRNIYADPRNTQTDAGNLIDLNACSYEDYKRVLFALAGKDDSHSGRLKILNRVKNERFGMTGQIYWDAEGMVHIPDEAYEVAE